MFYHVQMLLLDLHFVSRLQIRNTGMLTPSGCWETSCPHWVYTGAQDRTAAPSSLPPWAAWRTLSVLCTLTTDRALPWECQKDHSHTQLGLTQTQKEAPLIQPHQSSFLVLYRFQVAGLSWGLWPVTGRTVFISCFPYCFTFKEPVVGPKLFFGGILRTLGCQAMSWPRIPHLITCTAQLLGKTWLLSVSYRNKQNLQRKFHISQHQSISKHPIHSLQTWLCSSQIWLLINRKLLIV